jgi:DNA-binding SARP family transcriptional activator/pimeloyl-ACP methyl ester carboxylesterase
MRFGVLGTLTVWDELGEPVDVPGDRPRRLLALLLARAGEVVSVDTIADLVWSDEPPSDPTASVHTLVSRLRRRLGSETIRTRPGGYLLDPGAGLDARAFLDGITSSRTMDDEAAVAALDDALGLWRGPAHAEFVGEPWLEADIAHLEEQRSTAIEDRAIRLLALGRHAELVPTLDAHVRSHPLRERAAVLLATSLHRSGRSADALAACRRFRDHLADELGLEPSQELSLLEVAILRDEVPSAAGSGTGTAGAPSLPTPRWTVDTGMTPRVAYLRTPGGRRIAWARVGEGPTLLFPPPWVSRIDLLTSGRDIRSALLHRLAQRYTVVLYDRPGVGLSAASSEEPIEEWRDEDLVEELTAVLDALGEDAVPVIGVSAAGPASLALAARDPRVDRLVLLGTYANGPATFGAPTAQTSILDLIRAHWGVGSLVLTSLLMPGAGPEEAAEFARSQRRAATAEAAAATLEQLFRLDVSDVLDRVSVPALVLHYREDRAIPFVGATQMVDGLQDATLIPLEGPYHIPPVHDVDRVVALIGDFLDVPG